MGYVMKKYLITIIAIILIVFCVYLLDSANVIDLDALKGNINSSEDLDDSSKKPETDDADVTVEYYFQDPESGDYQLKGKEYYSVEHGKEYTFEPKEIEYYDIDAERSLLTLAEPTDESVLFVYYLCETCTVTFSGGEGATLISGEESYQIRKGQTPTAPEYYKVGCEVYAFDKEIGKTFEDSSYVALWKPIEYKVTLILLQNAILTDEDFVQEEYNEANYVKIFTYFDETFELPIPSIEGYIFEGWHLSPEGGAEAFERIESGTEGDLILYSVFNVVTYKIDFEAPQGYSFNSIVAPANAKINVPKIAPEEQKVGYGLNWYKDPECTELYYFSVMPSQNVTLYGKWEEDTGAGFFGMDFSDGLIESEEEFILYLDYVAFNYITEENKIVTDVTFGEKDEVLSQEKIESYINKMQYPVTEKIVFASTSSLKPDVKFSVGAYIEKNCKNSEAKNSFERNDATPYNYKEYNYSGRGEYADFYIEKIPFAVEVETTNQLVYAVERGYKPICAPNSSAERVYNKAKTVLNAIVSPRFDDYEKALAIFEYLVLNVQYDDNAANYNQNDWGNYDAWFLEGVFDKNKAVCDGISKAFSLMCNIEGIPCVQVAGNSHAWCKVKINNGWSIVDPTHGNTLINGSDKSVISHEHFMMTEQKKIELGYDGMPYKNIKADYSLNYFALKSFEISNVSYSFVANSALELSRIIKYYLSLGDLGGCVIDFIYTGNDLNGDIRKAFSSAFYFGSYSTVTPRDYGYGLVVKITF